MSGHNVGENTTYGRRFCWIIDMVFVMDDVEFLLPIDWLQRITFWIIAYKQRISGLVKLIH